MPQGTCKKITGGTVEPPKLAVSAPFDRSAPPLEGAVFVFVRVADAWLEQVRVAGTESAFGNTIVLTPDGATLFIGAENSQSRPVAGAVHVY